MLCWGARSPFLGIDRVWGIAEATRHASTAAYVSKELVTFLAGFIHLTLSFDGWLSKGHDEIYTVHITTPWP